MIVISHIETPLSCVARPVQRIIGSARHHFDIKIAADRVARVVQKLTDAANNSEGASACDSSLIALSYLAGNAMTQRLRSLTACRNVAKWLEHQQQSVGSAPKTSPGKKPGKPATENRVGRMRGCPHAKRFAIAQSHRSASRLPLDRFQTSISPTACQSLQQQGYAVIDNVFGSDWSHKLKEELVWLRQQGKMHLNSTHLIKHEGTELLEKQHVYEAELRDMVGSTVRLLVHDHCSRMCHHV